MTRGLHRDARATAVTAFVDNVLFEALPYALVALGVVLTFRYLRLIDLTFAASFVLGPAVAGALMVNGVAFPLAILVGLVLVAVLAVVTIGLMWLLELDGLLASLLTSFAGFQSPSCLPRGRSACTACTRPWTLSRRSISLGWSAISRFTQRKSCCSRCSSSWPRWP